MKEFYHDNPDGVIGNEDCGQMSAWYVFSSLGFYPAFPASNEYVSGSPLFDQATINLPDGKSFKLEAKTKQKIQGCFSSSLIIFTLPKYKGVI